jgi:hypothetical protein
MVKNNVANTTTSENHTRYSVALTKQATLVQRWIINNLQYRNISDRSLCWRCSYPEEVLSTGWSSWPPARKMIKDLCIQVATIFLKDKQAKPRAQEWIFYMWLILTTKCALQHLKTFGLSGTILPLKRLKITIRMKTNYPWWLI